ncbi:unnamed protein product [Mytilus coruscus]|uniref:MULE transposase domain-containing protein n=1 Tax=Mytilus coruscus TaxID=42192 RepID=A0A6J8BA73_MYTCO|nr:unnamed protein product [Mytilus coruscus]
MHRYETVLKSNSAFKKHVSWFSSTSDTTLTEIALYEYQGTYVINSDNKVRTHPKIIRQVQSEFSDKKPKEIFLQMNQDNSMTAPHDTKQIKMQNTGKKKANQPSNSNNIADEILEVLSMLNDHPFVQQVIHKKGQVPSILCYTEKQMTDFKMFLSRSDGAVGEDRTFNLGSFFVTALVYKHHRVVKKDTKDHPIFIGPMLLHKDASYKTHYTFFSHLASEFKINLELRIPEDLVFGCDDEKAMTNDYRDAFPSATRLLCSKHLKIDSPVKLRMREFRYPSMDKIVI